MSTAVTTSTPGDTSGPPSGLDRVAGWLRLPLVAGLLLLAVYVALSFTLDSAGFLGTDTGGKVATLRVMADHGTLVRPDVGYWAAPWDADGRYHGLYYTVHLGDQYVNVTSLPMIVLAEPLWRIGGYRAALLLPMVGAVAAAFVARGIARRARGGTGWTAFWLTGLASPVVVYALDLWEHTLGVACMGAGVLLLLDEILGRSRWWRGLAAGALFGLGFSMRTESAVYGVVSVGIAVLAVALTRRAVLDAVRLAVGAAVGFVGLAFANGLLERVVLGQSFRSGRAAGTATAGGSSGALRLREAFATSLSPFPSYDATYVVLAVALAGSLLLWAWSATRGRVNRVAPLAAGAVALLYVLRLSYGLGFWPGLLATTPLAAVALVRGWSRPADRWVLAFALVPLPLVFAFQFPGGALPQWGGRYILTSGLLLGALGAACLPDLVPWARRGFMVAAVATAVLGVAWLSVRTHQVAAAGDALNARSETVLIARDGFTAREFGATYGDKRWLAVGSEADLLGAADVAEHAGADSFAVVDLATDPRYPAIPGFHETGRATVPFVDPQQFTVTTFTRDGS